MATTASTVAHMASVTSGPGVARSKDRILSIWRRARSGQSGPCPGRGKGRAVVLARRHANGCPRRRRIDLIPAMSAWSGATVLPPPFLPRGADRRRTYARMQGRDRARGEVRLGEHKRTLRPSSVDSRRRSCGARTETLS
jgi:hypothetical protein